MTKRKTTTQQPAPAAPQMEMFGSTNISQQRPDNNQVLRMVQELLDDMDLHGKKREPLEAKSIDDKWQMIVRQRQLDSQVPAPEYLLKELRKKVTPNLLNSVAQDIATIRMEWARRFYKADGHNFLLSLLSMLEGKLSGYEDLTSGEGEILLNTLICLRNISNSMDGIKLLTKSSGTLRLILGCIFPPVPRTVDIVLEISLVFLFCDQTPEKQTKTIASLLDTIRHLYRGHHGWKIISNCILENKSASFHKSLASFLNGLFMLLQESDRQSLHVDWALDLDKANVVSALKTIRDPPTVITSFIENFNEDLKCIKSVFPNHLINPFSKKAVFNMLLKQCDPNYLMYNVSLGLLDLSFRNPAIFKTLSIYIFNVTNLIRINVAAGHPEKCQQVYGLASDLKKAIKLRLEPDNHITSELAKRYFGVGADIATQPIMELISEAASGGLPKIDQKKKL